MVVRELLLRPDLSFLEEFGQATPPIIRATHRMSNLKALTLGHLWTSNPFGEGLRTSNSFGTSTAVIQGTLHDGMQPQSGPPGLQHAAWTIGLHIPFIDTLTIETLTYCPIRDLFGELPYSLQHLISVRAMHIRDIGGIRRISCERVYDPIPIHGRQGLEMRWPSALEHLEMASLATYPTQDNWAPHLTTISRIVTHGRGQYFIPSRIFQHMKGIKKIGPVACSRFSAVRRIQSSNQCFTNQTWHNRNFWKGYRS